MNKESPKKIGISSMEVFDQGDKIEKALERLVYKATSAPGKPGKKIFTVDPSELESIIHLKQDLIYKEEELNPICNLINAIRDKWRERIMEACSDSAKGEELVQKMNKMIEEETKAVLGERTFLPAGLDQKAALEALRLNVFDPSVDEKARHMIIEWCKIIVLYFYVKGLAQKNNDAELSDWPIDKLMAVGPCMQYMLGELERYGAKCDRGKICPVRNLAIGMVSHLKIEINYKTLVSNTGTDTYIATRVLRKIRNLNAELMGQLTEEFILDERSKEEEPFKGMGYDIQSRGLANIAERNNFITEKRRYIKILLLALKQCGEIDAVRSPENLKKFLEVVNEGLTQIIYTIDGKSQSLHIEIYQYLVSIVKKTFGLKKLQNVKPDLEYDTVADYSLNFMISEFFGDDGIENTKGERKMVADILGSLGDRPMEHELDKIQETVIQTGAQLLILAQDLHAREAVLFADKGKNAGDDLLKLADSVSSGATTVEIPEEIKNYLSLLSELKVKICRYNAALAEIFSAEPSAGQNKKIAALIKEENELAASLDRLLAEGRENYTAEIARLRTDSQKELHHLKDVMKEQEERFKKLIGEIGDLEKEYNHYLDE